MGDSTIIGVHPDSTDSGSYSDRWADALGRAGVQVRTLDLLAPDALVRAGECDGVMWRWSHSLRDKQAAPPVLHTIEHVLGIPVFPDTKTCWHYDRKLAQASLLPALGAPVPDTRVFWDRDAAKAWAATAGFPQVFKLSVGAGSSNVLKLNSRRECLDLIDRMFSRGLFPMSMNEFEPRQGVRRVAGRLRRALRSVWSGDLAVMLPEPWWRPERGYVYFQEFLPGNDHDTRITVIGHRAFGYRRLNRPGDFRASGSGRIDWAPGAIDPRCVEIAFDLSRKGGFQSMAYDFLQKQGEPVVIEISYTFVDSLVHDCPGHWDPDLQWVEGQMWPEDAQVRDFLGRVRRHPGAVPPRE